MTRCCILFGMDVYAVDGVGNYVWNGNLMLVALFLMDCYIARIYLIVLGGRSVLC